MIEKTRTGWRVWIRDVINFGRDNCSVHIRADHPLVAGRGITHDMPLDTPMGGIWDVEGWLYELARGAGTCHPPLRVHHK